MLLLIKSEAQEVAMNIFTPPVMVGAERTVDYFNYLSGKNVALVVNQTSVIGKIHLADSLLNAGIKIKTIFSPEHGFRGTDDAGKEISNGVDAKTGVPLISLYGKEKKPSAENLKGIDVVVYDIQDVGVRFYTYISTLHYVMEACAENNVELLLLDRPNPNGFYVDGPVLDTAFKSFIGVDAVPIVYGMSAGEYAQMLNGEKWLHNGIQCNLKIVSCLNYTHNTLYQLPVNPSPNLRSMTAIYLYPSICLFEGTIVSVGRGTNKPFMLIGYPDCEKTNISFTPKSMSGASDPPYKDKKCNGFDLSGLNYGFFEENKKISLLWLQKFYTGYPDQEKFFTNYFDLLAGTDELRKQIVNQKTETEIRRSWEPKLSAFKLIRKKYLLYEDFE
ncbi:MAG: DUF1343 domain-containing protein [Chitinophagales bacterium]|nr:DUF1343 domain-containing protein [Chitinophagales bacterium]